jgi:hypothetical protein
MRIWIRTLFFFLCKCEDLQFADWDTKEISGFDPGFATLLVTSEDQAKASAHPLPTALPME